MSGSRQSGFTLMEMLVALAIISLLALSAHTLSQLSFNQLRHLTQPESVREETMYRAWQWLENDILQLRGDLPWHMDVSMDANGCMQSFTFVTENRPAIAIADRVLSHVRYRVDHRVLFRDVIEDRGAISSHELLSHVDCLHPRFWQKNRWQERPLNAGLIHALSFNLTWKGPTVERIWPVEIAPAIQQEAF